MHCTFYRPQTVNTTEFYNIVGKLHFDLLQLETKSTEETDVYRYVHKLCSLAKPSFANPDMRFLGLDDPENMPRDARVEFLYLPTYIATAFIMKATLLYPSLLDEEAFCGATPEFNANVVSKAIASLMLACTAREFSGADVMRLSEVVEIFDKADAEDFILHHLDMCPEFNLLFWKAKIHVNSNDETENFYCS